jgi:hypothetical protein
MDADPVLSTHYQALFEEFNTRYFAGRLPLYHVRVVPDLHGGHDGEVKRKQRVIRLKKRPEAVMISLLLHEMAHAATNNFHARKWLEEMGRLKQEGAPINKEDLEPDEVGQKKRISHYAFVLAMEDPRLTVPQFIRYLVAERGLADSQAQLRRHYPRMDRILHAAKNRARKAQQAMEALRTQVLA